jgi:hypothetical protein
MDAKKYLQQYLDIDKEISADLREIEYLRSKAERITTTLSMDGTHASGHGDKVAACAAKIADIEYMINKKIINLYDVRHEIEGMIEKVDNPTQRLILRYRYLTGKDWKQIERIVDGYSMQSIFRIHGEALQSVKKFLKDESK